MFIRNILNIKIVIYYFITENIFINCIYISEGNIISDLNICEKTNVSKEHLVHRKSVKFIKYQTLRIHTEYNNVEYEINKDNAAKLVYLCNNAVKHVSSILSGEQISVVVLKSVAL